MSDNEITQNEDTGIWKQKAIGRRLELKELGKRMKELHLSRENWKSKYLSEKLRADNFEKQLSADLQVMDEKVVRLKQQRNVLRTRQSRAEAKIRCS